jgi:hypothetical protein
MQDIYGFIHIGLIGRWKQIYSHHLSLIKKTGLYEKTKKIFVGTNGNFDNQVDLLDKIKFIVHHNVLNDGEIETIRSLHDFCKGINTSKIWYIHTKGASHPQNQNPWLKDDPIKIMRNVEAWRTYLEFFCIIKHENCITALDNYDICGAEWKKNKKSPQHFSGNFWWANSSYISKLTNVLSKENLSDGCAGGRWAAEMRFIGTGDPSVKCFFNSRYNNLYYDMIYPFEYKEKYNKKFL